MLTRSPFGAFHPLGRASLLALTLIALTAPSAALQAAEKRREPAGGRVSTKARRPEPARRLQAGPKHGPVNLSGKAAAAQCQLLEDPAFRRTVEAIGRAEDASNGLAVAMTYLDKYPKGRIQPEHIKKKMVGHVGATTAISRTWLGFQAAVKDGTVAEALKAQGISQAHVVTGPGHGAAAVFALHFLDGSLSKVYPKRYPRNARGMQNLISDFCKPHSPLPSHTFPGIPSISEGGELGYSLGIATGAGLANPDSVILAQIGDKEAEEGALAAAIMNHNAYYDFRKGLVLPVLHANGLGISSTASLSARSDTDLRRMLRGLGFEAVIVDAEKNPDMRSADRMAKKLERLVARNDPALQGEIERLQRQINEARTASATLTNAQLQQGLRGALLKLAAKKALALKLDSVSQELERARAAGSEATAGGRPVRELVAEQRRLQSQLRATLTPFIVYREAKGGGKAPAFVDGKPTKGAPPAHQLILAAKELEAKDPKAREVLQRWLGDLSHGKGPAGLNPGRGSELDRALREILPGTSLRPGGAPLATSHSEDRLRRLSAARFVAPLKGGRGSEIRGGNELIDRYLSSYMTANPESVFLFSADTAESNRLKLTVETHGRHTNQKVGANHPENSGPRGRIVDVLSEQHLMAMAQGVANSGKQAIITNYEAFFPITSSMVKQYLKFRKQADEANGLSGKLGNQSQYRAAVPNMVLHLSSLGFAQDHNGFSHQNFGFVNELATEPRRYVEVLMPAEANSAVLAFDRAVKGKNKVVAVVADKQPRRQFLSPKEAAELVRVGGAVWSFASSVDGIQQKPDVVLAASGGYHTDEVLAASRILRELNSRLEARGDRGVRFTTVNVVAPFKLRAPEGSTDVVAQRMRELGGRSSKGRADRTVFDQATFERLFPAGVPIVYAFGGAQTTAEVLFAGRQREVSAHGYRNEGSTTTRFDMMVRNGCDRFSLVIDAVERAYRKGAVSSSARDEIQRWCRTQLDAHARRMKQNVSVDPPEITNGVW